jgi:hypothetical protein
MKLLSSAKSLSIALLISVIAGTTSGCVSSDVAYCDISTQEVAQSAPVQVAAVLAPTDNFIDFSSIISASAPDVKADLGGNLSKSSLRDAIGRELSVVLADGTPSLVVKRAVKPVSEKPSDYDIQSAIESTFGVFKLVASCSAGDLKKASDQIETSPESDLLGSLGIAADQFNNPQAEHKIYILGNGIQTAGDALNMQEPGQFPKSEESARLLAEGLQNIGALPDLKGAHVYWYGLGQVDGKVQSLSQKARDSLVSFWQQVISLSGGVLTVDDIHGQVGTGVPNVKSIKISSISVLTCSVVRLYEKDGIEYQPDSASFVNQALAQKAAATIAHDFESKGCDEMTVTGYAAAGVDKATYDSKSSQIDSANSALTLKRAKAFATLIKASGYSGSIKTSGAGTCGTEWGQDGKALEALQKLCRRVEVSN